MLSSAVCQSVVRLHPLLLVHLLSDEIRWRLLPWRVRVPNLEVTVPHSVRLAICYLWFCSVLIRWQCLRLYWALNSRLVAADFEMRIFVVFFLLGGEGDARQLRIWVLVVAMLHFCGFEIIAGADFKVGSLDELRQTSVVWKGRFVRLFAWVSEVARGFVVYSGIFFANFEILFIELFGIQNISHWCTLPLKIHRIIRILVDCITAHQMVMVSVGPRKCCIPWLLWCLILTNLGWWSVLVGAVVLSK